MLEPIRGQNRLTIGSFDQIFQGFQLVIADDSGILVFIVDSAVRHLKQLVGKRSGICRINVAILQRDNEVMLYGNTAYNRFFKVILFFF